LTPSKLLGNEFHIWIPLQRWRFNFTEFYTEHQKLFETDRQTDIDGIFPPSLSQQQQQQQAEADRDELIANQQRVGVRYDPFLLQSICSSLEAGLRATTSSSTRA